MCEGGHEERQPAEEVPRGERIGGDSCQGNAGKLEALINHAVSRGPDVMQGI